MNDQESNRRFDRLETKIDKLEQVTTNSMVVKVGQGIVASIWAALIGTVAYLFRDQ